MNPESINPKRINNPAGSIKKGESAKKRNDKPPVPSDSVSIGANDKDVTKITILSTNDIHGRIDPGLDNSQPETGEMGGIFNLGAAIDREKAKDPDNTIILDAGDITDGGAVSDYFHGKPVIDSMEKIGYDAMTLGNHEMCKRHNILKGIIQEADFPILGANVVQKDEEANLDIKPYIIKKAGNINVGVLGLVTLESESMMRAEDKEKIGFLTPQQSANEMIPKMKKDGADVIVVLSHLGIDEDVELAAKVKGIDVIVGGHSHTLMKKPVKVDNTLITQAGSFGRNFGKMQLEVEKDGSEAKIISARSELVPVRDSDRKPDEKILGIIGKYKKQLEPILSRVIGSAPESLDRRDYHYYKEENPLNNFVSDALKEKAGTDIFIHVVPAVRDTINSGDVNVGKVYKMLPWEHYITKMKMKGKDVKQVLEAQVSGPAHCGSVSGLKVVIDSNKPKGRRLVSVTTAEGKPLEDEKVYDVGSEDYFADGALGMTGFKNALSREDTDLDVRDALISHIEGDPLITGKMDGRFVNLAYKNKTT